MFRDNVDNFKQKSIFMQMHKEKNVLILKQRKNLSSKRYNIIKRKAAVNN